MGALLGIVLVIQGVPFRQHAAVQNAQDEDAARSLAVEDDVAATLHAPQTGTDFVAGAA